MHFIVLDLEMCKVAKRDRVKANYLRMETIQIGAVKLDENYNIIGRFNELIKPEYSRIDNEIQKLTAISDKKVRNASDFYTVLKQFADWVGNDDICVSWSMTDKNQLVEEIEAKEIDMTELERIFEGWIDCQELFDTKLDMDRQTSLKDALIISDIEQEGSEHDGLVDAYNTAKLFIKLQTEPDFKINEIYKSARFEEQKPMLTSMAGLFKDIQFT